MCTSIVGIETADKASLIATEVCVKAAGFITMLEIFPILIAKLVEKKVSRAC
jgi:hypothetical protein